LRTLCKLAKEHGIFGTAKWNRQTLTRRGGRVYWNSKMGR